MLRIKGFWAGHVVTPWNRLKNLLGRAKENRQNLFRQQLSWRGT